MKKSLLGLLLCICLSSSFASSAAEQLVSIFSRLTTIQGDFTQTVYAQKGQVISVSKGTFKIRRPNQFYWNVNTPMKQLTIADGKNVWLYQPDLEQVTESLMTKKIGQTPLAILSGSSEALLNNFNVVKNSTNHFSLTAKTINSNFHKITLTISGGSPQQMQLFDSLNQKTVLAFSKVGVNHSLNKNAFQFTVPKGVDVIKA
jgi:outer membrane lipoprotein carrier protein